MKQPQSLIAIPVVAGAALIISGAVSGVTALIPLGAAVLFIGCFVVPMIVVVVTIAKTNRNKYDDNRYDRTEAETEADKRKAERMRRVEEITSHSAELVRNSAKSPEAKRRVDKTESNYNRRKNKTNIFGCLFAVAFVALLITSFALFSVENIVGGVIAFFSAAALIFCVIAVSQFKARSAVKSKRVRPENDEYVCRVDRCVQTDSDYMLYFDIDGELHVAHTDKAYKAGDIVRVRLSPDDDTATVVAPEFARRRAPSKTAAEHAPEKASVAPVEHIESLPRLEPESEPEPDVAEARPIERSQPTEQNTFTYPDLTAGAVYVSSVGESADEKPTEEPARPATTHRPTVGYKKINKK